MKINKDNVIGAIVMLLIVGVITWGVVITVKIDRVAQAHDNLVTIMSPVINQIQQQAAMLAYIDVFWVFGWMFLLMIPLVFLMKKTTPRHDTAVGH